MDDTGQAVIERIKAAADRVNVPVPPLGPVIRRARTRRLVRLGAVAGVVLLAVAGVLVPLARLLPLAQDQQTSGAGGSDFSDSYRFSDLRVEYPYQEQTPDGKVDDPTRAGVTFSSTWTRSVYPGEAQCTIRLFDADANVVGHLDLGYDTQQPTNVIKGQHAIAVPVEGGAPVSATMECGPGTQPTGAYAFANLRVVQNPSPRLVAHVTWASEQPPLTHWCVATFDLNGETVTQEFTLSVGSGDELERLLGERMAEATPLGITCEPYTGQNGD